MSASKVDLDLTICIPHLNDCKNLNLLLTSIWRSDLTGVNYEILVCDGFSNDNTLEIIKKWKKKINIFLIQTSPDASASLNLNAGLKISRGEIFCRLDSRCIISKDYFKVGIEIFKLLRDNFCALGPIATVIPINRGIIPKLISKLYHSPFFFGPSKFKASYFYRNFEGKVSSIYLGFYDKKELKNINGFDSNLKRKQDLELLTRLKFSTKKSLYTSAKLKLKYQLAQDRPIKIAKRALNQGKFLTTKISSSRPSHFLPIFLTLFVIFVSLKFDYLFYTFSVTYLTACFVFSYLEIRRYHFAFFGIFLFPIVHLSFVCGNIIGVYRSCLEKLKFK